MFSRCTIARRIPLLSKAQTYRSCSNSVAPAADLTAALGATPAESDENVVSAVKYTPFPWASTEDAQRGRPSMVLKDATHGTILQYISRLLMNQLLSSNPGTATESVDDIINESINVFKGVIVSIFKPLQSSDVFEGDNEETFVPEMKAIFDPKLADFFEKAIKSKLSDGSPSEKVTYKLQGTMPHKISSCDVIFKAKRGEDLSGLKLTALLGIYQLIPTDMPTMSLLAGSEELEKKDRALDPLVARMKNLTKYVTLRVGIEVPCLETFYVENVDTQEVLQGDKKPLEVIHTILLETSLADHRASRGGDSSDEGSEAVMEDWMVVDVDGWVQGNIFWGDKEDSDTLDPPTQTAD